MGDTVHLESYHSTYFTGRLYYLTFCVTLTGFDYTHSDHSCAGL